jgi:hypothetical protein
MSSRFMAALPSSIIRSILARKDSRGFFSCSTIPFASAFFLCQHTDSLICAYRSSSLAWIFFDTAPFILLVYSYFTYDSVMDGVLDPSASAVTASRRTPRSNLPLTVRKESYNRSRTLFESKYSGACAAGCRKSSTSTLH